MKKTNILLKPFYIFMLFCFLAPSLTSGKENATQCPDETTLTRNARIAIVTAQELAGKKNLSEACDILTRFMSDSPNENHAYVPYTLAGFELDQNHLSRAASLYQKTLNICPDFTAAWQNLAKVSFDIKDYTTAAKAFEKVWLLGNKKKHIYRFHAAVAHIHNKAPQKALEHLFFLTNGKAGTPEKLWIRLMANLCIKEKQSQKALIVIEKLLKNNNPESYLFKLATSLYLDLNQYKKAANALSAYGMMKPLTAAEQRLMADLYYNIDIPYKAACLYEKTLENNKKQKVCERTASAFYEAFEYEKAMAVIDQSLKTFPDSHILWKIKAWIFYGERDFKQASFAFSKAAKLKKSDHKSLFMTGFSAFKAGEHEKASTILKNAALKKQYKRQVIELLAQIESTK